MKNERDMEQPREWNWKQKRDIDIPVRWKYEVWKEGKWLRSKYFTKTCVNLGEALQTNKWWGGMISLDMGMK